MGLSADTAVCGTLPAATRLFSRQIGGASWSTTEAGGSLAALQEILGHASIVTTQRYARLSEVHVKAEAERVRDEFGKILGRSDSKALALN